MIPSDNINIVGGWLNNSGKVINQKMSENEMDNRGSESIANIKPRVKKVIVKEQRVDGSWQDKILSCLRCNLMNFERNYQIKNPSNQINKFSIFIPKNFNPWFITGFSDAESSFKILIQPRKDSKIKWRIKAIFSIVLNKKDKAILEKIKLYFGVGKLYFSVTKVYYRVESFEELKYIINHFIKFPLVTEKKIDFLIFKECFEIIESKKHLTEKGFFKLV